MSFEPGSNTLSGKWTRLRAWYPDHVTLRRYLVDEALLARERGVYWRIGGPVWV